MNIDIPGPGTATGLLAVVSIYTAGFPAHLSNFWRWMFFLFAVVALGATILIEWWAHEGRSSEETE
jgi:ABC-type multidrug transport system permease subunit